MLIKERSLVNKDKIIVPNKLLFEQVLDYLQQGKSVTIAVKGSSMKPFLKEGERVLLEPFKKGALRKGIIVLAKKEGQMVLHRVVRYNEESILLAGDGNFVQHELVRYTDVHGIAVCVFRGEDEINLKKRWRCNLGLMWYWARPLRRIVKKIF